MEKLLSSTGVEDFRSREMESFKEFALDPTGTKIAYEEYIDKIIKENESHSLALTKDFDTEAFKKEYENDK